MVELIFSAGGSELLARMAIQRGYLFGSQLPKYVYYPLHFADQDWKKPNRQLYMSLLDRYKPVWATVLDLERPDQYEEVMGWAEEASQYVQKGVIIIPKYDWAIDRIPETINGKDVRLGYSVPTSHGGTTVPLEEFYGRPVHLLGGSPQNQFKLYKRELLDVVSLDNNYINLMCKKNCYFSNIWMKQASNRHFPMLKEMGLGYLKPNSPYYAMQLSLINVQLLFKEKDFAIRYGSEADYPGIYAITKQFNKELGFVSRNMVRDSAAKAEVYVAYNAERIVGFLRFHVRKDGTTTIYEIATDPAHQNKGVASALISALNKPLQLKTTTDNLKANTFYQHYGFTDSGEVAGRVRTLRQWRL